MHIEILTQVKDVYEILKNGTKCIKTVYIVRFFILKSLKKFELDSLTRSKVIALLIFTTFTRDLMEVRHLVHYSG
jgi:hypothetical protein